MFIVHSSSRVLEGAESSSSHSVADAVWTESLAVAAGAVDLIVGSVVQVGRIQRTVTIGAVEAATMPDSIFADHLFGGVDAVAAAGTALTLCCLQAQFLGKGCVGLSTVDRDQSGRVSVTETLGSPSLSVAGLAVDFFVGPVARQHGIQRAFAVVAAEAQFVVLASF